MVGQYLEVEVVGRADARISAQGLESFTPELASHSEDYSQLYLDVDLEQLMMELHSKASPKVGSDDLTSFPSSNRDLTLERINTLFVGVARTTDKSHGHTRLLPKYAFSIGATTDENNIPNYPRLEQNTKFRWYK